MPDLFFDTSAVAKHDSRHSGFQAEGLAALSPGQGGEAAAALGSGANHAPA
jgi:hypothetical protein